MIMKGQKRKLPPEDVELSDGSHLTWESQRQFVFSVSLNKYQRGQELPEPSLRRSVLIANTLRQVSLEGCWAPSIEGEVSLLPCASHSVHQAKELESSVSGVAALTVANSNPALPKCQLASSACPSSRSPASCFSNTLNAPPSVQDEDEDWGSMSTDPDFSLSAAISSILTALDSTLDGSPQAAPRVPLRSLENLSGCSEGGVSWLKQGVRGSGRCWDQQEESRSRDSSMEVMRSSYLSDLTVEDLFQDIDTSLLERDMGILGLRGSRAGFQSGEDLLRHLPHSSTHPFSLNQKCLPSFSSFSPASFSSSTHTLSSPPPSTFPTQSHVREGLDLEHLMEILVES
ncbi:SERTA domain-containing protein 3 [Aulostomus maculatus]